MPVFRISINVKYVHVFLGTTWMQEITWLLMNDGNISAAKQTPVYMRSPFLEFKDMTLNEVGLDIASQMASPRVIKSHLPLKLMPSLLHKSGPKDPLAEIKQLAQFLGKTNLDDVTLSSIANHCSFQEMKSNPMTNHLDVYSIDSSVSPLLRKGTVGDWKSQFTVQQDEDFDKVYSHKMAGFDIPFLYDLKSK
ncbi:sulfotransferase 1C4-like [Aplysia californica]|uniref:Sulfotransferase 1C4-like n=1 Tax=Aplysia californica TaxID=6500 RepID=A0ABM0JYY0_APLCA|nr:sulfotransferase 1C4-like [Aplysia californica]